MTLVVLVRDVDLDAASEVGELVSEHRAGAVDDDVTARAGRYASEHEHVL